MDGQICLDTRNNRSRTRQWSRRIVWGALCYPVVSCAAVWQLPNTLNVLYIIVSSACPREKGCNLIIFFCKTDGKARTVFNAGMLTRSEVNQRHATHRADPFLKALLESCGSLSTIRLCRLFLSILEKHKNFIVWRLHGEKKECIFSVYKKVSWKRLRKWSINLDQLQFFFIKFTAVRELTSFVRN